MKQSHLCEERVTYEGSTRGSLQCH